MKNGQAGLLFLAAETLSAPQSAATRLIQWAPSVEYRLIALVLAAVLSILSFRLSVMAVPPVETIPALRVMNHPWLGVPVQLLSQLLLAGIMTVVGRAQGRAGRFLDAVLLVAWVQGLLAAAQLVQTLVLFTIPFASLPLALAVLGAFLWILTNFTAALHGLESLLKTFGALILTFFLALMALAIVLGTLGLVPPATEIGNV